MPHEIRISCMVREMNRESPRGRQKIPIDQATSRLHNAEDSPGNRVIEQFGIEGALSMARSFTAWQRGSGKRVNNNDGPSYISPR